MRERDGYQAGVPCWVATVHADPKVAVGFYTELFGWAGEIAEAVLSLVLNPFIMV